MSLEIPETLLEAVAAGDAVLFVGAGMSMPQLPGWKKLLEDWLAWSVSEGIAFDAAPIRELIEGGDLLLAAGALRSANRARE